MQMRWPAWVDEVAASSFPVPQAVQQPSVEEGRPRIPCGTRKDSADSPMTACWRRPQRDVLLVRRRRPGAVACDELPWREVHQVVGGNLTAGGGDQEPGARASLVVQRLADRGEGRIAATGAGRVIPAE